MSEFSDYRSEFKEYTEKFPMREIRLKKGVFSFISGGPENWENSRRKHKEAGAAGSAKIIDKTEAAKKAALKNVEKATEKNAEKTAAESLKNKPTLVFLNGGMNSYEMWLRYMKIFSKDYRVLSFDYPLMYETNDELIDGMHELFTRLSIKSAVLIGASMGGIIAQLYARKYPDDVAGLCLMSTAGLTETALKEYGSKLRLLGVVLGIMKIIPYSWVIKSEKKTCRAFVAEAEDDAKKYFNDMFDHIYENYTKEKDIHVVKIMRDFGRQKLCTKKTYEFLAGRVLLLLPEDDSAFPKELQEELKSAMTDPVVVPGIKGGHLTTELYYEDYIKHIRKFLEERILSKLSY